MFKRSGNLIPPHLRILQTR